MAILREYKPRTLYLNKLIAFQDKEPVKVVTGIRRCGKSTLLKLMVQHLLSDGIQLEQIIEMNFESYDYKDMTADSLYRYVKDRAVSGKRLYLFFDEIQRIPRWEEAVNAFRIDIDCDIYITGSNAYLLSSEYSTYLSGRCVEIKMLPLSFKEFLSFHQFRLKESERPLGHADSLVYDQSGEQHDIRKVFEAYLRYGGMPGIVDIGLEQENVLALLDGIYSTVVVRDILEREARRGKGQVSDAILLRKVIHFLADNIGNSVSANAIGNNLSNEGLIKNTKGSPSVHTIQSYLSALLEAYIFYEVKRFDIKGREYLRTLGKYYIVDIGLRNYLLGFRDRDFGHILENIVYFELIRRGYDVAVGKIDTLEIDFIATNALAKNYIQVTESLLSEDVRQRELAPLMKIRDNYPKTILTLDRFTAGNYEGIEVKNVVDWLLGDG